MLSTLVFANEQNFRGERNTALDTALEECKTSIQGVSGLTTSKPDMSQMEQGLLIWKRNHQK